MSLDIRISGIEPSSKLTTLTTATVLVDVENKERIPVKLDQKNDRVCIEVRSIEGDLLLTIDEDLRHEMLFERADSNLPDPLVIKPGMPKIQLEFPLCEYYYSFAAGSYLLNAIFVSKDGEVTRESERTKIEVEPIAVSSVMEWYENPVFGNRFLLCYADKPEPAFGSLRWVGVEKPKGSYFSKELAGLAHGSNPFPAVAAFWQLEDLEEGLIKVLVQDLGDGRVLINRYFSGDLDGESRTVEIPPDVSLVPHAFRLEDGTVFIFGFAGGTDLDGLVGFNVAADNTVSKCLQHKLNDASNISILGGPDVIRIISAQPDLKQEIFDHQGKLISEKRIFDIQKRPIYLNANMALQVAKLAYLDPLDSRLLKLVETDIPIRDEATHPRFRELELSFERDLEITEIDFVIDAKLGVAVLFVTSSGELYFRGPDDNSHLLERSSDRFFPRVLVCGREVRKIMLGFFRKESGYRFIDAPV